MHPSRGVNRLLEGVARHQGGLAKSHGRVTGPRRRPITKPLLKPVSQQVEPRRDTFAKDATGQRLEKTEGPLGLETAGGFLLRQLDKHAMLDVHVRAALLGAVALPGVMGGGPIGGGVRGGLVPAQALAKELAAEKSAVEAAREIVFAREGLTADRPAPLPVVVERAEAHDHDAWFSTDWFIADRSGKGVGDPEQNLWAEGGPLDKLDTLVGLRSGRSGNARATEMELPAGYSPSKVAARYRGGMLLDGAVSERNFTKATGRAMYIAAFGADVAQVIPPIRKLDFMDAEGRNLLPRLSADATLVPMLDGKPLDVIRHDHRDGTTIELQKGGHPLDEWQAGRAYFAIVGADGSVLGDNVISQTLDAEWIGNCDGASLAGLLFEAPKHPVERDGVTFSQRDIQGLLSLVASELKLDQEFIGSRYYRFQDSVRLDDGKAVRGEMLEPVWRLEHAPKLDDRGGDFRRIDAWTGGDIVMLARNGERVRVPASSVDTVIGQLGTELTPHQVRETVIDWALTGGGVADVRGFESIHNRPFTSAVDHIYDERPLWADEPTSEEAALDPDLRLEFSELEVHFPDGVRRYRSWTAFDDDDEAVAGGWYLRQGDPPPDFLWRPRGEAMAWPERLNRNPDVSVELVRELYEASLA